MFRFTNAPSDLNEVLKMAQGSVLSLAPFDLTEVFFVPEQISVIPQITAPKPRTSRLYAFLTERPDDVHLVVDSYRTGRDALFYCRVSSDLNDVHRWITSMRMPTLMLNHADGDFMIAAPASVFVA